MSVMKLLDTATDGLEWDESLRIRFKIWRRLEAASLCNLVPGFIAIKICLNVLKEEIRRLDSEIEALKNG